MITGLGISGFKRFEKQAFDIAPLTILAGLNGSGKTSLIHALLLAWAASASKSARVVSLNGQFGLELGVAEEVRNRQSDESIDIQIRSEASNVSTWSFKEPSPDAFFLNISKKPKSLPQAFSMKPRTFCYLSAERLGPRDVLSSSPLPANELEVGVRGEHSAQMLSTFGDKPIKHRERLHPEIKDSSGLLLKYEVERWLSEIARPIEIDAIRHPGSNVNSLRFRCPGEEWVRAPNMGFGVSYALPVILAGLTTRPKGLIIVENPEAHLHPAGQSRMGVFLAWLAGLGVQVILETHSDHVLNGVRRAIAEHAYIDHKAAIVNFFESGKGDQHLVQKLEFTSRGSVSHWPTGFFDQYQIDIASLGRIRRRS